MENPDSSDEYQEAAGSGAAAWLAFLHITLWGVLAFGAWFVALHGTASLLSARALGWQLFLPISLGYFLYLPSDALTRAICRFTLICSIAATLAVGVRTTMVFAAGSTVPPASDVVTNVTSGVAISLAVGYLLRRLIRTWLPKRPISN